jgi:two-component system nitrogen regulation sensor histidine kinase NtrY
MLFRTTTPDAAPAPEPRRRPLDNPRVLIAAAVLLIAVLAALFWLSDRSSQIALPLLTDVLLYPLLAVDLALLFTLVFVLARNLLKLWVEQRQARPFGRFRAKLVAALLAMTIIPSVLVLISGSEIIRNSAARWFSEPVDEVLRAAQSIASRFYQERRGAMELRAGRLARVLPAGAIASQDLAALTPVLVNDLATMKDGMIEVYGAFATAGAPPRIELVVAQESESLPRDHVRASADRLAARAAATGRVELADEPLESGGTLVRAAAPILSADGQLLGAVVVSQHLGADIGRQAELANDAYEKNQALDEHEGPNKAFYLINFLPIT